MNIYHLARALIIGSVTAFYAWDLLGGYAHTAVKVQGDRVGLAVSGAITIYLLIKARVKR